MSSIHQIHIFKVILFYISLFTLQIFKWLRISEFLLKSSRVNPAIDLRKKTNFRLPGLSLVEIIYSAITIIREERGRGCLQLLKRSDYTHCLRHFSLCYFPIFAPFRRHSPTVTSPTSSSEATSFYCFTFVQPFTASSFVSMATHFLLLAFIFWAR